MNADLEAAAVEQVRAVIPMGPFVAARVVAAVLGTTVEVDCPTCEGKSYLEIDLADGTPFMGFQYVEHQDCPDCSDGKVLLGIGEVVRDG